MKPRLSLAAEDDLAKATAYYDAQSLELGGRFLDEVEAGLARIEAFPVAWHPLSESTRRYRLHRFPYGLIYQARPDGLVVIAIAHLLSEPGQWLRRSE